MLGLKETHDKSHSYLWLLPVLLTPPLPGAGLPFPQPDPYKTQPFCLGLLAGSSPLDPLLSLPLSPLIVCLLFSQDSPSARSRIYSESPPRTLEAVMSSPCISFSRSLNSNILWIVLANDLIVFGISASFLFWFVLVFESCYGPISGSPACSWIHHSPTFTSLWLREWAASLVFLLLPIGQVCFSVSQWMAWSECSSRKWLHSSDFSWAFLSLLLLLPFPFLRPWTCWTSCSATATELPAPQLLLRPGVYITINPEAEVELWVQGQSDRGKTASNNIYKKIKQTENQT